MKRFFSGKTVGDREGQGVRVHRDQGEWVVGSSMLI